MTREELLELNAELVELLTELRDQIDEKLAEIEAVIDEDDEDESEEDDGPCPPPAGSALKSSPMPKECGRISRAALPIRKANRNRQGIRQRALGNRP